jgi:predicted transcriptional regulator
MMMKYRNSGQIVTEVLENTQSKINVSSLLRKTNTNYGSLKNLLEKLTKNDLVVKFDGDIVITDKGRQFLEQYKKFYKMANSFGLEL